MKLQSLIYTQFSLFKMQIETATYTIMDEFAFSSHIVQGGNCFIRKKKSFRFWYESNRCFTDGLYHHQGLTKKKRRKTGRQAGWPDVKSWQSSILLMCPWAKHRIPSCFSCKDRAGPDLWPPCGGWQTKRDFSQWGLIKYHIIIWMQLIVSLSV